MAMTQAPTPGAKPASQWELLLNAKRIRGHGVTMQYKEVDVLAAAIASERATKTRFADLFGERIWAKLGAESDAYVRCDAWGTAVPSFGICATGRDLARWGQMCLDDGSVEAESVVPSAFMQHVRGGHRDKIDPKVYMNTDFRFSPLEGTAYRSFFWFRGPHSDAFEAVGGLGQAVNMNTHWQTVIVCFSSWMFSDPAGELDRQQALGLREIARVVGEQLG